MFLIHLPTQFTRCLKKSEEVYQIQTSQRTHHPVSNIKRIIFRIFCIYHWNPLSEKYLRHSSLPQTFEFTVVTMSDSIEPRQHGVRGVYYGGEWLDMEDCVGQFDGAVNPVLNDCDACLHPCPRSRTRSTVSKQYVGSVNGQNAVEFYDIVIVGAGCIGAAIARALCQIDGLAILWVEAADDVSQGATKGNSGIVHAGYDDTPGSVRAQHCWKGNQMFAQLDRELRFGYQKNGSLVIATTKEELAELYILYQRGQTNGVQNLQVITDVQKLRDMEPHISNEAIAALYAPDAGNVIPYEFAIALAENAVDNGVELRIRTKVVAIDQDQRPSNKYPFTVHLEYWEPAHYVASMAKLRRGRNVQQIAALFAYFLATLVLVRLFAWDSGIVPGRAYHDAVFKDPRLVGPAALFFVVVLYVYWQYRSNVARTVARSTPLAQLVEQASIAVGSKGPSTRNSTTAVQHSAPVPVEDMLVGGSGSAHTWLGVKVQDPVAVTSRNFDTTVAPGKQLLPRTNRIRCSYVINCAGGASDEVAALIGDTSFHIKPRLGDYILLNRNQVCNYFLSIL
jgi:FAD dependent oxidoreductase